MLIGEITPELSDLAADLTRAVERLSIGLPAQTLASLAELTRLMNCYYSNLIEGHKTKPHDIDKAMRGEGETSSPIPNDPDGQKLLKLALAHIECQAWIDNLYASGELPDPASIDFICEVHRRFYNKLPSEFLDICDGGLSRTMVAGRMRRDKEDVVVGQHLPPCGGAAVDAFMQEYQKQYSTLRKIGSSQRLFGIAAAHHRLLYIHPFDDGNGRVARLVSHAMMLDAGMGACGLWSISRGLARGLRPDAPSLPKFLEQFSSVSEPEQYKFMMAHADMPRMGDLDGRGALSQKRLQEFCEWFLCVAYDQVHFMHSRSGLLNLEANLQSLYIQRRNLDPRCGKILGEIARLGQLQRGSVKVLLGVSARTATDLTAKLIEDGIVRSDSAKAPLRLHFSPDAAEILFPSFFSVEALIKANPN